MSSLSIVLVFLLNPRVNPVVSRSISLEGFLNNVVKIIRGSDFRSETLNNSPMIKNLSPFNDSNLSIRVLGEVLRIQGEERDSFLSSRIRDEGLGC